MNETLEKKKHYLFVDSETWNILKVLLLCLIISPIAK